MAEVLLYPSLACGRSAYFCTATRCGHGHVEVDRASDPERQAEDEASLVHVGSAFPHKATNAAMSHSVYAMAENV